MLTVKKLRRKPKHFHNFTGLTPQQFDELLVALEPLYEQAEEERLDNPNRLCARGTGHKFNLELPERLLMSLIYFRLYIIQALLDYLFDHRWYPEQELPKPKDKDRRKDFYSGKRKRHTAKMQVLSTKNKLILHLYRHVPGWVSDLLLLRATGVIRKIPKGVVIRVDKGYEGLEEEYPQVRVQKPRKARRGHPLTVLEKRSTTER